MRRKVSRENLPPERLLRFDVADWPTDSDEWAAFSLWCAARDFFWSERQSWPTGFLGRFHEERSEGARLRAGWSDLGPDTPDDGDDDAA